ncbi:MAG: hypothetical protein H0X25_11675 [Acidobacteriales bacterium]|nr:hypothetical protein [Terriglobales bacterium]
MLDLPDVIPGANTPVGAAKSPVTSVAIAQISASPPHTRVTINLESPQPFALSAAGNTVTVALGEGNSAPAAPPQPSSVAPTFAAPSAPANVRTTPAATAPRTTEPAHHAATSPGFETQFEVIQPPPPPPPPKVLEVTYQGGQLSIRSERSTLAEVLAEVKKRTGAEVTVPPGAQEPVFATIGPGPVRDVLAQLLTGSNFNFIMTSDENDPTQLRSLTLLPKTGGGVTPAGETPAPQAPEAAQPQ